MKSLCITGRQSVTSGFILKHDYSDTICDMWVQQQPGRVSAADTTGRGMPADDQHPQAEGLGTEDCSKHEAQERLLAPGTLLPGPQAFTHLHNIPLCSIAPGSVADPEMHMCVLIQ